MHLILCTLGRSVAYFSKCVHFPATGILKGQMMTEAEKHPMSISEQIAAHYGRAMANAAIPLFRNFTFYARSLPVRMVGDEFLPLYTLPYVACTKDIDNMVEKIKEKQGKGSLRKALYYLTAPPGSGKTASVLPAFLRCAAQEGGATHYLYLAFKNNDEGHFQVTPYTPSFDKKIAERQGAAFIVQCVKNLLEHPDEKGKYLVPICVPEELEVFAEGYVKQLDAYLEEKLGENHSIWFHVDEHYDMCDRDEESKGGKYFSKGAMETLASVRNAKAVATYIDRPTEVSPEGSSGVCRLPIALPLLDVDQLIKNETGLVPQLAFNSSGLLSNWNDRRKLATLKLRLGLKIMELGIAKVLNDERVKNEGAGRFLRDFEAAAKLRNRSAALKKCINLCSIALSPVLKSDVDAMRLLLGIPDAELSDKKYNDLVILPNGHFSCSIQRLLSMKVPLDGAGAETDNQRESMFAIYEKGRDLFERYSAQKIDLFSNSPLEAAYFWSISCRSAMDGDIHFRKSHNDNDDDSENDSQYFPRFRIQCSQLVAGRLFNGTDSSNYTLTHLSNLKKSTIYYADEGDEGEKGKDTHPLADLFFVSNNDELVLVDITGSGESKLVKKKAKALATWIQEQQSNITQYTLHGVVLAPFVNQASSCNSRTSVCALCGNDALSLLGGLAQLKRWL